MPRGSCSGVTPEWTRCGKESRRSRFCYPHTEQSRWLRANYDTLEDIEPHAKQRCCIGMIKDNSRLCNNRVAAGEFQYCHLHRAQAPPTWSLPKSGSKQGVEVRDATFEELKDILLDIVAARDRWLNSGRSKSSSQKPSSSQSQGFSQEWRSDSQYKESSQKSSSYTRSTPSEDWESYFRTYSQSSSRYGVHQSYEDSYRRQREQERKAEKEKQEREEQERKAREERARAEEARRAQQESRYRQWERFFTTANTDNTSSSTRTRTRTQTAQAAVNHYCTTLNTFDKDLRSLNLKPLVFQNFPWPVLVDHHYVKPSDVTEEAAKDFFSKRISSTTYRAIRPAIMKQSRKFWHPDAFTARGIPPKIKDAEERKHVEEKVNMVSKIVNNHWDREFK